MDILLIYFVAVNGMAFCLMGVDKARAKKGAWRIPERNLILSALFGGAPGLYLGMYLFRHKTMHPLFRIGIPVLILLYVLAGGGWMLDIF
ncbi:Uncharacterized membrane protein YsdA, DUF1294 family [Melghirimyces thermohalophilus]|uniref:Uncharacterized membrane protein YsdA, DUF1294 family n=2 Tax=Melghirimyces thermohalophilus TaxID=1236220 RepID=A0A1G6HNG9_9BACL|nr:Uncharacterized membrane protein YsdA, DUF1294 family [Melghirimyces thermohalophilus]